MAYLWLENNLLLGCASCSCWAVVQPVQTALCAASRSGLMCKDWPGILHLQQLQGCTSWGADMFTVQDSSCSGLTVAGCAHAGVMRGCGRQLLASGLNLVSYWGLGLPLALVLGLHYGLGVQGLWYGLATTTSVQVRSFLLSVPLQLPQPAALVTAHVQ